MTAIAEEIEHFSKLSKDWWDPKGPLHTLHDILPARLEFLTQHASWKDKTVLDVGCGGGIVSEALTQLGAKVTGIDETLDVIEVAQKHAQQKNLKINYHHQSLDTLSENEKFDTILCLDVLEHVNNPKELIAECIKRLAPNGHLFLSTLNHTWQAYWFGIIAAEQLLNLVPKNTHHYERFITPAQMAHWLREFNFEFQAISGLKYNPLTHKASLCPSTAINYITVAIVKS